MAVCDSFWGSFLLHPTGSVGSTGPFVCGSDEMFSGGVNLYSARVTDFTPHAQQPYPPYYPPIISHVSDMLTSREVLCTDMPWATAWYGDQISIFLPKNIEQYYEINDYKQYISGIYFTPLTKNKPFVSELLDGPEKSWLPILSGRMPADFPLKAAIALNRQDQLFVSDRDRWSNRTDQNKAADQFNP